MSSVNKFVSTNAAKSYLRKHVKSASKNSATFKSPAKIDHSFFHVANDFEEPDEITPANRTMIRN